MNPSAASLAFASFLGLAASATAQDLDLSRRPEIRGGQGSPPVERVVHVTYDLQGERIRSIRESSPNEIALGTPCFDNSEPTNPLVPYVVANSGEDLLNWGTKNCPGASRLRSFTIAYRSEALDPAHGGPGATFSIAIYTGTAGFGQPGTEIFRRTFTGMPSNPSASLILFTIDFGVEPLPLSDGPFGWSYLQLDGLTGPVLVRAPKPILGTLDALDIYSPGPATPATYVGTFNYGGCQGTTDPCANTWMQLDEIANSEVATSAILNGTGVNPVLLTEIFPARIGHVWAARVDASVPTPFPPVYTILFGSSAPFGPVRSPYGEILIDPAQELFQPWFARGGYTFAVPADTALIGFRLYLQAAVIPPATTQTFLTNALRVRVGY